MNKQKIIADLHMHSIGSDGSETPEIVVQKAKALGLDLVALTDHDTVSMVSRAQTAGKQAGLPVISGIEFSVAHDCEVHILGLFVNVNNADLLAQVKKISKERTARIETIAKTFTKRGMPMTVEEIKQRANGGSLSRVHVAQTMVDKGYCTSKDQAFKKYLSRSTDTFVEKDKISKKDCIAAIAKAGGISVLAHPMYYLDYGFDELIDELLLYGLNGIEAYHSDHSDAQCAMFDKLAQKKGMLVTCGSDFHGLMKPKIKVGSETRGSDYLQFCLNLLYKKATKQGGEA